MPRLPGPRSPLDLVRAIRAVNADTCQMLTDVPAASGPMKTLIPIQGPTSLILRDGDDHARRRRVVQPGFHRRAVDAQLRMLIEEADRTIDTWA